MQPITATTNTASQANLGIAMDITNLLEYALQNNLQIFELYAQEWLQADSPNYAPSLKAKYQAALQSAAQTLGAVNGK